ncbi:hypothetical protein K2173_010272 [Erythroxylum novogranatense]|uniref:RING-type E3 ubiquitin transferase n=1 Tax=Erythroxylum novogranatense TaxID=1862640 RepID=A0AAV8TDE8_9ROSI|nr:hypothetical protein K2173_010272 [Erythroxylum novogranatense]
MASLMFLFSLLSILQVSTCDQVCGAPNPCTLFGPEVRFPFGFDSSRCTYPGFKLSCNYSIFQSVLTLPQAGNFIVDSIDYVSQTVCIRDPNGSFPKMFLRSSFNLSGSPFVLDYYSSFTFLNCSSATVPAWSRPVRCLSAGNYTVVAVDKERLDSLSPLPCAEIEDVSIPGPCGRWSDCSTRLKWKIPDCRSCRESGGSCSFKSLRGLAVGCSYPKNKGLPRSVKYGITLGLGIPGLMCAVGIVSCLFSKVKAYRNRQRSNFELATSVVPQRSISISGLDELTIESYPKTMLGESRRLPKPTDNTCAICLSEYQPKEALRTIPECNHYFHVDCIDEWLRVNGTCPLCRNSPESSDDVTPSSSVSSSNYTYVSPR